MKKLEQYLEVISNNNIKDKSFELNKIVDKIKNIIDSNIKNGFYKNSKSDLTVSIKYSDLFKWNLLSEKQEKEQMFKLFKQYFNKINEELKQRYIKKGWTNLEVKKLEANIEYKLFNSPESIEKILVKQSKKWKDNVSDIDLGRSSRRKYNEPNSGW